MTLQRIQDKIEDYGLEVAKAAYLLGQMNHASLYSEDEATPDFDNTTDLLRDIVKSKLKGE